MSWAYLHLLVNHFPIVGFVIGTLLLFSGLLFQNQGVKISGLGTILFAGFMAVLAYLTGSPAEEAVTGISDFAKSHISWHENVASVVMYVIIPAVLLAAVTLYSIWKKEKSVRFLIIFTLVLSLVGSIAMMYVGHTGGQFRHNELRQDTADPYLIEHQD